ncbi:DNA polymerase Y family protein [Rhizobacter sp. SG703]|uniref:Y-family DNA polymerase n=1 Tax=Rhizobacter sp. SG703 TaxID=2587140 RepID=UPI0014483B9A|nr:DNA polymerase Y family protein [Rhizobacter sp. SG703]NKI92846.1 protein ImuB [Rhizobacter sp. SG703]
MLWIGLHLPLLPLESFLATLPAGPGGSEPAVALVEAHRIVHANAGAQALGVKPGLKRATALALAPQLLIGQADALRDRQALTSVAHAALAFTPAVSFALPQGVLLEVEASLRYFGGHDALLQRLRDALRPLGHALHCVSTPTAQGSALLSRSTDGLHCADVAALQRALDAAPVWLLGPGREHWEALQGMGLNTLGDLRSLPRAGLTRRFGEALLVELDSALGRRPDPRVSIELPASFDSALELFARADTTEQVLHGAQVLLARLVAWLAAQHAFVRRFSLQMKHEPRWRRDAGTPLHTTLEIALAEPSRDPKHLMALLRERLSQLALPAPTLELALRASDIARQPPPNTELFPTPRSEREGLTRLLERLQARLGRERVQRLVPVQDHRPECAGRMEAAALDGSPPARTGPPLRRADVLARRAVARPVWLLPQALPLAQRQSRPLLDGAALQLLAGPERIEAGWWDGDAVERDYFIAQQPDGALVWIYRARMPLSAQSEGEGWFLQGRFG